MSGEARAQDTRRRVPGKSIMTTSRYAPVAVFAYRRVGSLGKALDNLQACPEYAQSRIYVFSDGPKNEAARRDVEAVRTYLAKRKTDNMTLIEVPRNKGLARSIIEGVERLTREHGRVIVIEDDLRLSPLTLTWFNAALDRYQDEPTVMQISAHVHAVPAFTDRAQAMFLPFTTTWGWATWARAWEKFDPAATGWEVLKSDQSLRRRFDVNGAYPHSDMLISQMESGVDSWGIRYYWTVFRSNGVVLFPPRPFVKNHGLDLKATHGVKSLALSMLKGLGRPIMKQIPSFPASVAVNPDNYEAVERALGKRAF